MDFTERHIDIPAEYMQNIFGYYDNYIRKIENDLNVTIVDRNGAVKITGTGRAVRQAENIVRQLTELSKRGNTIGEQNVDYAIMMEREEKENVLVEMDEECICHTVTGKPIKPKTLGQKRYVDAMKKHMIVFGLGPAGTGKTYLAMAMAIMAFKKEEVGRIILTRPAIEAGEKLGFLPGDLQSKVDPYLRPLYDALYQIMGADSFQKNISPVRKSVSLTYGQALSLSMGYRLLGHLVFPHF